MFARRLVHRCGKARIATPAATAAGHYEALVGVRKLEEFISGFVVVHDRPDRNFQSYPVAIASGLVRTFAVPSALRAVLGIEAEMNQRVVALAGLHDDVPALAAVAAGRTTARDELLPPKGHAAIATVSRLDPNFRLINEHCGHSINAKRKASSRRRGRVARALLPARLQPRRN
jgi:hypothetical protein